MKVRSLVTGGGGFIGRHLVRLLVERGETVRVLELPHVRIDEPEVEVIRGSICDPDAVGRALKGVHRLYHVAANPNLWHEDKSIFMRVNYEGTQTVLGVAGRFDLERIVYTSTESILKGSRNHNRILNEDPSRFSGPPRLEEMPGIYFRSKYLAEQEAFAAADKGQPVVIVNPTMPVGPGDRNLTPPTQMILAILNGKVRAYLECGMNLVDVRDVALGHLLAAERGRIGERYILGHENLTLMDVFHIIHSLTGVPVPKFRVPYGLAVCIGAISEFAADYITRRPPLATLSGVRLAGTPMFFSSDKAVRELGMVQTPIRKSLTDAIQWLMDRGHVVSRLKRPVLEEA